MALTAFSGSLASLDLLEALGDASGRVPAGIRQLLERALARLGPASGARQVFELLAEPLMTAFGAAVSIDASEATAVSATVRAGEAIVCALDACGWNGDLRRLRAASVRQRRRAGDRWWIGTNGSVLRIQDAARAYSHRAIDIDVAQLAADDRALAAVAVLLDAREPQPLEALAGLVLRSDRHRAEVGRSLQAGVESALTELIEGFSRSGRGSRLEASLGDALTVVYRILFLLFAEARGLVPRWHPIYRDNYTIESLRPLAEGGGAPAGLWQSIQAISRLAHRGCTAGTLRVVPFNGRLFAPSAAPLAESFALDDTIVGRALLAVTTRASADRRERISYADLGVEQLGSVYERILEYAPQRVDGAVAMAPTGRRKRSGTFYTPRTVTEFLVRRALAPLVRDATPERILALRVVDPAMGSGAFLVAACRYLAAAYETALVKAGTIARADVTLANRAGFRRAVAQRCLYGVDLNPTAVQLARLSLWLCTLAADRPLTFLDHRLRAGNSVAGAAPSDVMRQPPGSRRRGPPAALPLFDAARAAAGLSSAVDARLTLEREPDDAAETVRRKERALARLDGAEGPLHAWRSTADAWCAGWFWPSDVEPLTRPGWTAFRPALGGGPSGLPRETEERWRRTAGAVAARERFFHWELEFPEVFHGPDGYRRPDAGFDAVIGNPPWTAAGELTRFSRDSGCYALQGDGHANLYHLFAERMIRLAAPGGRIGAVMPFGLLSDSGGAALRRHLLDACSLDDVVTFDNGEAVFPIHRGMRFSLLTLTNAGRTGELRLRSGLRAAGDLDDMPEEGALPGGVRVAIGLVDAFSGSGRAVPDLRSDLDRAVLARLLAAGPALSSEDGWHARFGRELNATEDRRHFTSAGLPVVEGKQLDPFHVRVEEAAAFIDAATAKRLLGRRAAFDRARLGYREVAAATNRLTLIAAILPAGVVATHSVFTLREPLDPALQWFLCGVFNSYVANYCIRLRGGTHVPASAIERLPVPFHAPGRCAGIAALAREAAAAASARPSARLQAAVARLYRLTRDEFAHVLSTFPLVAPADRSAALMAFEATGL